MGLLLLLVAGCAAERLTVAESDWQIVPAAQRAKLDHQTQSEVDGARSEAKLAARTLAEVEHAPPEAKMTMTMQGSGPAVGDATWAAELAQHDRERRAALMRIDSAAMTKRRAELIWHQRWVEAANDRIDMAVAQRELTRGQAVDRNLLGDDTYETAPLRGQFSQAQVRWYKAAGAADQARDDFERAARELTTAKDAYAALMRNGPGNSMAEVAIATPPPKDPLQLPSWSLTRFDIRRKNGMRHFIDQTVSTMQLRTPRLHISPALMAARSPDGPAVELARPAPQAMTKTADATAPRPAKP